VSRREATKAANRAAILGAAREVFTEQGYDAAGVRDIVRRTELASGTFYNYFPDKAAIFRALVEELMERARPELPTGAVEEAFRAFFAHVVAEPGTLAFLHRNLGAIREHFPDALPAEVEKDVRAAIAAGALPAVDAAYCAHAMIAVALELGRELTRREPPDVEGATRFASALFLGGLPALA
jgi:AcrR family transcriptional regulator